MPWKEKTVEGSRAEFVSEAVAKEKSISQLCREYGITRKTGYKWLERVKSGESLENKSRTAKMHPHKTPDRMEAVILDARGQHPAWGARKLKRYLENQGYEGLPAQSTICEILKRNGLILPEESEAHTPYKRFEKERPNEMWQVDFKGDFGLLNETRCYPLTVLDDHSRFSLCLEAKGNQRGTGVFASFERLFLEYGLPDSILCDNGKPWGDSKSGYTQFDVWLMQLGILPIHGRPLHPQTQGKDERFHRTLIEEVLKRESFYDCAGAQKRFDIWRHEYNYERPHNALGLETPSKRYQKSKQLLPQALTEPEYDSGKNLRKVNYKGYISICSHQYYLSESLIGKLIEVKAIAGDKVDLYYGAFRIAKVDIDEQLYVSRRIYRESGKN